MTRYLTDSCLLAPSESWAAAMHFAELLRNADVVRNSDGHTRDVLRQAHQQVTIVRSRRRRRMAGLLLCGFPVLS